MLDQIKDFVSENGLVVAFLTATTNIVLDSINSISTPIIAVLSIIVLAFTAFVKYEDWVEKRQSRLARYKELQNKLNDDSERDNTDIPT
jgi:hypothetical protein